MLTFLSCPGKAKGRNGAYVGLEKKKSKLKEGKERKIKSSKSVV